MILAAIEIPCGLSSPMDIVFNVGFLPEDFEQFFSLAGLIRPLKVPDLLEK